MSKIPEAKLLCHIERGISQLTPNRAEELWDRPVVPADGSEWYLDTSNRKTHTNKKKYFISTLAACFALCILATFLFQSMPSASIYLDVNPSVELNVNYRNRITSAVPCNSDAETILEGMDLRGTDLDVALYAILGSMVHHGYLTETKDTILVSVHSANAGRAQQLELAVTDMVTQSLDKMIRAGEVLSQQINEDDVDQSTPGKAAFVDELEEKYPQLKKEHLDDLTVDEIVSHLNQEGLDYSEYQDNDNDEDDDLDDDPDDDLDDDPDDDPDDDTDEEDKDTGQDD